MPRSATQPIYSPKKKHICTTCDRSFTTSGHLARHSRVHTGERNHRCPFPGCETRCSRQDNLQQHYRIHLSPGSRRNSIRTNSSRKRASPSSSSSRSPVSVTPQRPGTPSVDQGRIYDSTPPLAQATLPSSNTLLNPSRISASSSPSTSYSPDPHHVLPALSSPALTLPLAPSPNYNYRIVTPNYHDQSLGNPFVNNATSQNGSHDAVGTSSFTYSHSNYGGHSQQSSRSTSPSTVMHSRHSLSHINNSRYPSSHGPPSPTSGSSQTSHSGPPSPTYPISYAGTYSRPHNAIATSQPAVPHHDNNQLHSQSYPSLFQGGISPANAVVAHSQRYLPPLTLAPIQDERYIRRLETPRHSQSYFSQPLAGYSQYHHSMGLGHGAPWKAEAMRKGVGAVVI